MKLMFYPNSVPEQWDAIEIERCIEIPNERYDKENPENTPYEEEYFVEPVYDDNVKEDFWSIYLHDVNGGVQCIADLPTKESAESLFALLENMILNYKDNGHLKK